MRSSATKVTSNPDEFKLLCDIATACLQQQGGAGRGWILVHALGFVGNRLDGAPIAKLLPLLRISALNAVNLPCVNAAQCK